MKYEVFVKVNDDPLIFQKQTIIAPTDKDLGQAHQWASGGNERAIQINPAGLAKTKRQLVCRKMRDVIYLLGFSYPMRQDVNDGNHKL